jgi:hypothetical protein
MISSTMNVALGTRKLSVASGLVTWVRLSPLCRSA